MKAEEQMATAKECFDDAKNYVHSQTDPVMWNIVNGLSALAQQVELLSLDLEVVKGALRQR